MLVNVEVQNDASELIKRYYKEFRFIRAKALQATANEVIKYTLPNSPHSKGTEKQQARGFDYNKKSASKLGGTMVRNIKKLQARIKNDILGDGIPEAYPTPTTGRIIKGSLIGKITGAGFVKIRQKTKNKNKKVRKNAKKYKKPKLYASNAAELIAHIKENTFLKGGSRTTRRMIKKGKKLIWIGNNKTANQAAKHFIYHAGYLLSGWTALQNVILRLKSTAMGSRVNMLNDILTKAKLTKINKGIATIRENDDITALAAINPNVEEDARGYQQRMINEVLQANLKKHVDNEMTYLVKKIAKEMKQRIKQNYTGKIRTK